MRLDYIRGEQLRYCTLTLEVYLVTVDALTNAGSENSLFESISSALYCSGLENKNTNQLLSRIFKANKFANPTPTVYESELAP